MEDWTLRPAKDLDLAGADRHRSYDRESGLVANVARFAWWTMIRGSLKLMHRLEIHGRENLPEFPSFVLVANHASHLDALVLGATLPLKLRDQLFPLAAGDVFFHTPALAAFSATVLNALPVWRKKVGAHAIQQLRSRLIDEPSIYILFPEGGRTRDGSMRPFKSGIGMMTAGTQVPVVPCHLEGTFEAFPPESYLPRLHKVTVRIGVPRTFEHLDNRRPGWDEVSGLLEKDIKTLAGEQPPPDSQLATVDPVQNLSPMTSHTTSTRN
ncbi:MAG: lysophospholipid acyltransferase family protein [Planctomycetota bacterium]|nr:lysophospholipid acyltransferase family protein [Planctomycetota bacterium]